MVGKRIIIVLFVFFLVLLVVTGDSSSPIFKFSTDTDALPIRITDSYPFFGLANSTLSFDYVANDTNRAAFVSGPNIISFSISKSVSIPFNFSIVAGAVEGIYYDYILVNYTVDGTQHLEEWWIEYEINEGENNLTIPDPILWSHEWTIFTTETENMYILMPDDSYQVSYLVSTDVPTFDDEEWLALSKVGNKYERPTYEWKGAPLGMFYIKIARTGKQDRIIPSGWISGRNIDVLLEINTRRVYLGDKTSFPITFRNKGFSEFRVKTSSFKSKDANQTYSLSSTNIVFLENSASQSIKIRAEFTAEWMDIDAPDIILWVQIPINAIEADIVGTLDFEFR